MTSNEMAKEMHKGKFESSLCLLDKNFSPSMKIERRSRGHNLLRGSERTSTAFTNIRNKMIMSSDKEPAITVETPKAG